MGASALRENESLNTSLCLSVGDLECEPREHDLSHFNFGDSPRKEGDFAQLKDVAIPDFQGFAAAVGNGPLEGCR